MSARRGWPPRSQGRDGAVRIARRASKRREAISLNLASMIDVTFLLLLYFLVTTVLTLPEDR
ncbi:MAG: biopolymer transporter ExbD, partial [Planctomycetota bacterium]